MWASRARPQQAGMIMSRRAAWAVPAFAVVAVLMLAAPGRGATEVTIKDNSFDPATITVPTGETVTWRHTGSNTHSVTADNGSFDSSPNCSSNNTGQCMTNGNTFSTVFNSAGTFRYYCKVHGGPGTGMFGTVTVTQASASPSASPRPSASPSTSPSPTASASPTPTPTPFLPTPTPGGGTATQSTGAANPSSVRAGEETEVSGDGFKGTSTLSITFQSAPVALGSTTSDNLGRYRVRVRIPVDATAGAHQILVSGPNNSGGTNTSVANVTILARSLPATGPAPAATALAGGLLLIGAAALVRRRPI